MITIPAMLWGGRIRQPFRAACAGVSVERLEARRLLAATPQPFHRTPFVEGQRIEAEDYDVGRDGVAYHDTTRLNLGRAGYRTSEAVDIVTGTENGRPLRAVGFTAAGEFLGYTINVATAGTYTVQLRVSNAAAGGKLHLLFDNGRYRTPVMAVPNTKDFNKWQTISTPRVTLPVGKHLMRLVFDSNATNGTVGNVDWLRLTKADGAARNDWQPVASSPTVRFEGYERAVGGKLYALGGYRDVKQFGVNRRVDVYDPITNTWTNLGDAPIAQTHAGVAVDEAHGFIYFVGGLVGSYNGPPTTDVWRYDTMKNAWSKMPPLPQAVAAGGAAIVNNQLHYFGGIKAGSRSLDYSTHYYLNLSDVGKPNAQWHVAAPMPTPRDHLTVEAVGGQVYVMGGEVGHDTLHQQQYEVDRYDPITDTWTRLGDAPIARSHAESSTFVTDDGKIVIGGGQVDDYKATDAVFMYDPASDHWSALAPLPMPLEGVAFQKIGNKLIVSMGYDGVTVPGTNTYIGDWPL